MQNPTLGYAKKKVFKIFVVCIENGNIKCFLPKKMALVLQGLKRRVLHITPIKWSSMINTILKNSSTKV